MLTRPVAENIGRVYAFFRRNKFRHLQFIPVLRPLDGGECAADEDVFLTSEAYAAFLKKAFSLYMKDMIDGRYTSIRQFDNFVLLAGFKRAEQCGMNGECTRQFVVEGDGAVYPCDFYCIDEYLMGNVNDADFRTLGESPAAVRFLQEGSVLPEKCEGCKYLRMCNGGCRRERADLDKCEAYTEFFDYALPHLKRMR